MRGGDNMKRQLMFLMVAVVFTLCSCNKTDDPVAERRNAIRKERDAVYVAACGPMSIKPAYREGIELAQNVINQQGGVLGKRLEITYYDDGASPSKGQSIAYSVSNDKRVSAVVGHLESGVSIATSLIYQYYGVLMLSPVSTSERLTKDGLSLIFRNIPSDAFFGRMMTDYCRSHGWNRIVVLEEESQYGKSLANSVEQSGNKNGMTVLDRISYAKDDKDEEIRQIIATWKKEFSFDCIILAGTLPKASSVLSLIHQELPDMPVFGGDALDMPDLIEQGGALANQTYVVSVYDGESDYPAFRRFHDSYVSAYGKEPDKNSLQGYDAVMLLAGAMQKAGSAEPEKVAAALRAVQDWDGPAGPYSMTERGDITGKDLVVRMVKDGKFVKISP